MSTIKNVIEALGYSNSNTLYYANSNDVKDNRSLQKLFGELAPQAIYLADEKENLSEIDFLDDTSLKTLRDLMAGDLVLSSGQT